MPGKEKSNPRPMLLWLIAFTLVFSSCGETPVPRPKGYFRIDFPEKTYLEFKADAPYSFCYPAYARLAPYSGTQKSSHWCNLEFDRFRATLHLSYLSLNGTSGKELEDAHELVYKHAARANAINEIPFSDLTKKVYGLLYEIEGNAASPLQFYLTDSTRHFLRGALYFNSSPNADSLQPVVAFLRPDIQKLMGSLEWK